MKHSILLLLLAVNRFVLPAQVSDGFSDSATIRGSLWKGMTGSFTLAGGMLKSDHTVANDQFYISAPLNDQIPEQWQFRCSMLFNPSSLNYTDLVLCADSADLNAMKNGCFVRLGGSSDEISLFVTESGISRKIADGKDKVLDRSSSDMQVTVSVSRDSLLLMYKETGSDVWYREAAVYFPLMLQAAHTGIRIRQSSAGFFGRHFLDDFYAGPVIRDTIKPVCDSVSFSGSVLTCHLSEPCRPESLTDTSAYLIVGHGYPDSSAATADLRKVSLFFQHEPAPNTLHTLQISSISDLSGNRNDSQCLTFICYKPESPRVHDLLITEIMADPEPPAGLPVREYVEITNVSGRFLTLDSCALTDGLNTVIPGNIILGPDSVHALYKVPGLNNASDLILLLDKKGNTIHEVHYSDSWYRDEQKKEGGYSLEMIDIRRPCLKSVNWRASIAATGGTPGLRNSVSAVMPRDSLAPGVHSFTTEKDSLLKLLLTEEADTNSVLRWRIGGKEWRLEEKPGSPWTFRFPFRPDPETTYAMTVSGFRDCEGNVSLSDSFHLRWPVIPARDGIVINEILSEPQTGGKDFVELYNRSLSAVDLSGLFMAGPDAAGRIQQFFPLCGEYAILLPGQYALLTEDTQTVCSLYSCAGKDGVFIKMKDMPPMPDDKGCIMLLNERAEVIDSVYYHAGWHSSLLASTRGVSLERLNPGLGSNEKGHWTSASSLAGFATPGQRNSQYLSERASGDIFTTESRCISPDNDGYEDRLLIRYRMPEAGFLGRALIFDVNGRKAHTLLNSELLGTEGVISWNGNDDSGGTAPQGIYILFLECVHPDGTVLRQKMSVVLTVP